MKVHSITKLTDNGSISMFNIREGGTLRGPISLTRHAENRTGNVVPLNRIRDW